MPPGEGYPERHKLSVYEPQEADLMARTLLERRSAPVGML